jgi:hypothetical protein
MTDDRMLRMERTVQPPAAGVFEARTSHRRTEAAAVAHRHGFDADVAVD